MERRIAAHYVAANAEDFKFNKYAKLLEEGMQNDQDNLIEKVRGIYGLKIKGSKGEGFWVVNAKEGKGTITYNGKDKPDVTFVINDNDIEGLVSGSLNPQKAFFQGKIKIQGNMGLAMKLTDLQKQTSGKMDSLRAKL